MMPWRTNVCLCASTLVALPMWQLAGSGGAWMDEYLLHLAGTAS